MSSESGPTLMALLEVLEERDAQKRFVKGGKKTKATRIRVIKMPSELL